VWTRSAPPADNTPAYLQQPAFGQVVTMNDDNRRGRIRKNAVATHHGPYWKRAHQHWPFWVGLFLMFAAVGIYVMTDSLSLVPRGYTGLVTSHDAR